MKMMKRAESEEGVLHVRILLHASLTTC